MNFLLLVCLLTVIELCDHICKEIEGFKLPKDFIFNNNLLEGVSLEDFPYLVKRLISATLVQSLKKNNPPLESLLQKFHSIEYCIKEIREKCKRKYGLRSTEKLVIPFRVCHLISLI